MENYIHAKQSEDDKTQQKPRNAHKENWVSQLQSKVTNGQAHIECDASSQTLFINVYMYFGKRRI